MLQSKQEKESWSLAQCRARLYIRYETSKLHSHHHHYGVERNYVMADWAIGVR